jgi:hypothetical protein
MLEPSFPGRDALKKQVDVAEATGGCTCGCATIDLGVDAARARPAEVSNRVPVDAYAHARHGDETFGLILFVDDGYISGLEIYGTISDPPKEFPPPDRIEPAEPREA